MLEEDLLNNEKGDLRKTINLFYKISKEEKELKNIIPRILLNKDLIRYMKTNSSKDSGLILGKMKYFDDIKIEILYGITYNFEDSSLNIFTFESIPSNLGELPEKTLRLSKILPSKKLMGVSTEEVYFNYPSKESFIKSLNKILQEKAENTKDFLVNFNEPFYN